MSLCQLSKDNLLMVMKNMLTHFDLNGNEITDETKHSDILNVQTYGSLSSMELYKLLIRYTICLNGCEDKNWPANWLDLTVAELADALI